MAKLLYEEITEEVIGAAFEVHNLFGYGYLEKVYQRAMQVELIRRERDCKIEERITVRYKGVVVGEYFADLLVDGRVIAELKVARQYDTRDEAQLLNQLKGTGQRVGLFINFGKEKVEFKRLVN